MTVAGNRLYTGRTEIRFRYGDYQMVMKVTDRLLRLEDIPGSGTR